MAVPGVEKNGLKNRHYKREEAGKDAGGTTWARRNDADLEIRYGTKPNPRSVVKEQAGGP
jgi:hypothetical protein